VILTVTLNPALDLTYGVDTLVRHGTHRVRTVAARPGGKGLNVARVLHQLGEPVGATGLIGGGTGAEILALLADRPHAFAPVAGTSRRTVTVVDGDATGFWEPGPTVTPGEWASFRAHFAALLDGADVVVLSGSLPPGVPADGYAALVTAARAAGVPVILDADGEPLRHGVAAGPDVVKPNASELAAWWRTPPGGGDPYAAARRMRSAGAGAVIATRGAAGLLAVTPDGAWRAAPPQPVPGNPTGAGDACVAALARGLRHGTPWPQLVADAVALSAAAVTEPVAGSVHLPTYAHLRDTVVAEAAGPAAVPTEEC
jgi:tagatose 6-phosphate kinase